MIGTSTIATSTSSGQVQEQGNNAAGGSNSNVGSTTSTKRPQEQTTSTNLVGEVDQQSKSSSTAKIKLEKSLSNPPGIVGAQSGGTTTASSTSASTHPAGGAPAPATASSAQQKQKTIKNEYKWKGEDWFPNRTDNLNTIRSRVYVTSASTMHTFLNILAYFRPMKNHQNQHGMVSNSNSGQSSAGNDSSSDNNYAGSYDVDDQLPEGVYYDWDVISDLTDMSYMSHLVLRCFELKNVPKDATTLQRYRVEVLVSFGISLTDRDDPKKIIELCSLPDGSFCRKEQQVIAPLKCIMKAPLNYFDSLMQEVHNLSIGGTSSTGAGAGGTTASSSGAAAGAGFLSSGGGGGAAVPTGMNLISAMVGIGGAGTTTAGGKSSTPPATVTAPAGATASSA